MTTGARTSSFPENTFLSSDPPNDCVCPCDCDCQRLDPTRRQVVSHPTLVYLELTPLCNNRCRGCGNVFAHRRNVPPPPLSLEQWTHLINQLAPSLHRILLTGGEATLFPDLQALAQQIDILNIPFAIFTNGRWNKFTDLLSSLSCLSHFQGFLISLHGKTPQMHGKFCGVPRSFNKTVENIQRAVDKGIAVNISVVINKHNWRSLSETIDFALALGVRRVVLNRYIGTVEDFLLNPDSLRETVQLIDQLRIAGKPVIFGNCIPQCFIENSSTGCSAGDTFCTIDPWGNVRPCNHSSMVIGNLLTSEIHDLWQSEAMQIWRTLVPTTCQSCSAFRTCHGGCRALATLHDLSIDPLIQLPTAWLGDTSIEFHLPYNACPIRAFSVRQEVFRTVLMKDGLSYHLSTEYSAVLPYLDGAYSVSEIIDKCGRSSVSVLERLYSAGLIELES